MTRPDRQQLEHDLVAARAAFDEIEVAQDAWERNRARLAARPRRRVPSGAVAAAVVGLLVLGAGYLAVHDPAGSGAPSSSSSEGGYASLEEALARTGVEVARVAVKDGFTTLRIGLVDESGEKASPYPDLCEVVQQLPTETAQSSSGGCTARDPDADDPATAIDYLTGGRGGDWTTVTGVTDGRVEKVRMWQADGSSRDLDLVRLPTGENGFGVLLHGPATTRPVRLVTYSDTPGTRVLQAVDLTDRFGGGWLPRGPDCPVDPLGRWPLPGSAQEPDVEVALGPRSAEVSWDAGDAGDAIQQCLPLGPGTVAAQLPLGDRQLVVLAPEATLVELQVDGRTVESRKAAPGSGTRFQVALLPRPESGSAILLVLDTTGQALAKVPLS